jgi:hypothetical protein
MEQRPEQVLDPARSQFRQGRFDRPLAAHHGLIRQTVTHDQLADDPDMFAGISGGWPKVLSNLKTLRETGRALRPAAAAA